MPVTLKLKLRSEDVCRRVPLRIEPVSMEEVRGLVFSLYHMKDNYLLSYVDEEGDKIVVVWDVELEEALTLGGGDIIRLTLEKIPPKSQPENKRAEKEEKEEKEEQIPYRRRCGYIRRPVHQPVEESEPENKRAEKEEQIPYRRRCGYIRRPVCQPVEEFAPVGEASAPAKEENDERNRVLAILLPMGFDVEVMNSLLDVVGNDVDAALAALFETS